MLISDLSLRVRIFMAAKVSRKVAELTSREALLLEIIGAKGKLSISELARFYPTVSSSTISNTITRLWRDSKLVEKTILPENQRITIVSLTEKGRKTLAEIEKSNSAVFKTVGASFGFTPAEENLFQTYLEKAISYFDKLLGLTHKE
jgi:DNA-binding MarR family transcriptional regulator